MYLFICFLNKCGGKQGHKAVFPRRLLPPLRTCRVCWVSASVSLHPSTTHPEDGGRHLYTVSAPGSLSNQLVLRGRLPTLMSASRFPPSSTTHVLLQGTGFPLTRIFLGCSYKTEFNRLTRHAVDHCVSPNQIVNFTPLHIPLYRNGDRWDFFKGKIHRRKGTTVSILTHTI